MVSPSWLVGGKQLVFLFGIWSTRIGVCAGITENSRGAVASESKLCSEIGIQLLARGGNAADALVGTTLCVGVIGMQHSGIGGGGFMLVRDSNGKYESIDFRETAPAAAFEDMYQGNVMGSVISGLASGVPGDVRGLEYLHNNYGALPWRAVCNPAIHIARYGFPVTEDLVRYMRGAMDFMKKKFLIEDPQFAIDFAPNGTLLGLNEIMTRKRYADTLEQIANHGSKAFYEGEIANYTIAAIQAANGTMTLDDLKNYKVSIRNPISIDYRGYKLFTTGAPSGGSVALSILKIIEGYDMSDPELRNLSTHRLDEAMRFSYGAHAELGDPAFFSYMDDFEATMLNSKTASQIRSRISDHHTLNVSAYDPKGYMIPENHGTSHIVTADASGMAITSTTTVNLLFGSLVVVPETGINYTDLKTGIIMNNEMNDFSIPNTSNEFGFVPSPINYIRPNKRPLSSITPIIVEHPNGTLYLAIGAAGGSRIITSTVQAIWHAIDHNMTLPEALKEPRLHDQLLPDLTTFEHGFDNGTIESMVGRKHNIVRVGWNQSAVQGVRLLGNGKFEAASEPRQLNSGGLTV